MRPLIRFGIRQAVLMNLAFIGIVIFAAAWAIPRLPVDRYPNFSFGEVTITTHYPGASVADVERLVTKRIEDSLRGMDDLEYVKSTSIRGQSEINVKFIDDTDYDALYKELRLRVLSAQNQLPASNGKPLLPVFAEVETDQWLPVMQVCLTSSDPANPMGKRQLTLLAKELQNRVEALPGVKRVDLWGDEAQQFTVALDPARLARNGVTLEQVITALSVAGGSTPAGTISTDEGERLLRVDNRYRSAQDVESVVVRIDGEGSALRVGDLIDRRDSGVQRIDNAQIISVNGFDAVICKVAKESTANAATIKDAVMAELADFQAAHADQKFTPVITQDTTVNIKDNIGVLKSNLLQGAVLVAALLTITIGLRAAVLTLSGMVFAFLGTLIYFWATGQSINELSLLGFVIVVGILVDDAIVVIDNITRLREEGRPLDEALIEGTSEVFWPVVSSAVTTMASFLPLLLMTGVVGQFFSLIPTAVTVALCVSLVEALFMLPLHVRDFDRMFGPPKLKRQASDGDLGHLSARGPVGAIARVYDRVFANCLRHPWFTVLGASLLFAAAIGVLAQSAMAPAKGQQPLLKLEFFPSDASIAEIRVTMPSGTALAETDRTVKALCRELVARGPGEISNATGFAGFQLDATYKPMWGNQYGWAQVELPGRDTRTFKDPNDFIKQLASELKAGWEKNGIQVSVQAQQGGPPTGNPINVRLTGQDDQAVRGAAKALLAWMASESALAKDGVAGGKVAGAIDLGSDLDRTDVVIDFTPDRQKMAEYGFSEIEAQRFVAALFDGAYVGDYRRTDDEIPVKVRLARSLGGVANVGDLALRYTPDGQGVRYTDLGTVGISREPAALVRRDFVRTATVTGNLHPAATITPFDVQREVKAWLRDHQHEHPGVVAAFGGEAESTGRSYASLGAAFLVSVFLIYVVLAMQFHSYLQPFIIMSNIVFAFTGVVLTMGVFGLLANVLGPSIVRPERSLFTVNSFIAIVALTGMVVNNAIVLIDFINRRIAEGAEIQTALRESVHLRLRAVLLTTLTTIAGMLPTAIGIPDFSLTWSPMATAFVAGLGLSTILTLLVVPILFLIVQRHEKVFGWGLAILGFSGISLLLVRTYL